MIAVIGGMGLIGSGVVENLITKGEEVFVLDRTGSQKDCDEKFGKGKVTWRHCQIGLNSESLYHAIGDAKKCEAIYNFAGMLGTSELDSLIGQAVKINIMGAVNVFDYAVANCIKKVFYPSKPNVWENVYTITKETTERLAARYNKRSDNIRICSLRIFNAFGPGQHLVPVRKIIPIFVIQAIKGLPIQIWGDGEQTVDLIYNQDIAKLAIGITELGHTEVLDCGSGQEMTVNYVADLINEIVGNKAGKEYKPMRYGETPNTKLCADIKPLKKLLGDKFELTDFKKAMEKTIKYYSNLSNLEIEHALYYYKIPFTSENKIV